MKSTVLLGFLLPLTFNSVLGISCGGLLEGEQGHFSFANASNQDEPKTPSSSCLWIIQLHYEANIRFTLDALGEGAVLNLYPEDQLTSCSLSNYTKLNSVHVGSSFEFLGKTLIVVLPNSSAAVAFSWHFIEKFGKNITVATMKNADYMDSPNGLSSDGKLEGINGRVVVLLNVNTKVEDNEVTVSWGLEGLAVTEPPVTEAPTAEPPVTEVPTTEPSVTEVPQTRPPVTASPGPIATALFAGTEWGLVALNLRTLEAKLRTSEETFAVAVNQNLQKVYWSELPRSSRIMRSNFNGSAAEIIVPPQGEYIIALAVHVSSGNVYFSVQFSNEITVCNALGENCAVVISNSSLANNPWSIALDYENNVIYWSNNDPRFSTRSSLIRANLDGSSLTVIWTRDDATGIAGIALEQPSFNTLYWADNKEGTIGVMDVNGSNNRTLVDPEGSPQPWGIQVDAEKIYFSNYYARTIERVNKDSGSELTTLFKSTGGINHIALFYAPV